MEEVEERIAGFIRTGSPHQVITLNPEILYQAQQEPGLLKLINGVSLVTADGVGIVWAARVTGKTIQERVTGIDLLLCLVARAAKERWKIFLLGGVPGVSEEAAERLKQQYPQLVIAGVYHGYFQEANGQQNSSEEDNRTLAPEEKKLTSSPPQILREAEVVEMIRQARPHLLFVGMGAPKQEKFIARNLKRMNVPVALGVGGSFDVLAGRVKRAPVWMQRLHLEWLGRLAREPGRWRRMLVLPRFAWLVLLAASDTKDKVRRG
jgi:N-acetylglucosaminyldiphosphoundecaprenol N-acetyl-beta-D-mannosaminyltransferase